MSNVFKSILFCTGIIHSNGKFSKDMCRDCLYGWRYCRDKRRRRERRQRIMEEAHMHVMFKLESDVNDYVKEKLTSLGLKKLVDFNEESGMSDYMKEALKGSAKTKDKTSFGIPDFHIEKYKIPIVIEDKLGLKHHIAENKSGIRMDDKAVCQYAVNGAIYYAKNMIASKRYDEVVAIGISGDNKDNIKISVYYVFSPSIPPKKMMNYVTLDFVQNQESFDSFYNEATVTDEERHRILVESREEILKHAKKLNTLMNNHNIGVDQRVVYVSGMLLSMQDIFDESGKPLDVGLTPNDLKGIQTEQKRDSIVIVKHLEEYLDQKEIETDKKRIMLDSFKMSISLDSARDIIIENDKIVSKLLREKASITKQVFVYLYEYVYKVIDLSNGALDIMAEMYSTFLKYALSDGAPLGKVLTPPYITAAMAKILDIDKNSRVMDLATGSAAFLVAAMDLMIADANKSFGKGTEKAKEIIHKIKYTQLLGVEVDAKMYTLAATNMILRGDGSTQIKKADTFKTPASLYEEFAADRLLLNPPFSYTDYGMPFFEFGLDHMAKGGRGAVIIQDSAGAGKAILTNQNILKKHRMLASIKMPADLFNPNAIVQTSIYVFEAGTPHNFKYDIVKFIDFRNDGYKRTERCICDVDHPSERYQDLYLIFKLGLNARNNPEFHSNLWDLDSIYCEDTITDSGKDWNFEQHKKVNTEPTKADFEKTIGSHFAWKTGVITEQLLQSLTDNRRASEIEKKEFKVSDLFTIEKIPSYNKDSLTEVKDEEYDYITRTSTNRGICEKTGYISDKGLNERGTFSLGLLQMTFFYRERKWYAGQFMRKIKSKYELNQYTGLYFETILSGLSPYLLSGLVRDVDEAFLSSTIILPVDKQENINFEWIECFVKQQKKELLNQIVTTYTKELDE